MVRVPSRASTDAAKSSPNLQELPVPTADPQHIYRQGSYHLLTGRQQRRRTIRTLQRLPRRVAHEQAKSAQALDKKHAAAAALVYSRAESAVTRKGMSLLLQVYCMQCKPGDPEPTTTGRQHVGSLLRYEPFSCAFDWNAQTKASKEKLLVIE